MVKSVLEHNIPWKSRMWAIHIMMDGALYRTLEAICLTTHVLYLFLKLYPVLGKTPEGKELQGALAARGNPYKVVEKEFVYRNHRSFRCFSAFRRTAVGGRRVGRRVNPPAGSKTSTPKGQRIYFSWTRLGPLGPLALKC